MSLTLLSPAAAEPVTLSTLKEHLRIDHGDEDALINGYLVAAVRAVEARAGLALMPQTWRWITDAIPGEALTLPLSPAAAVSDVAFLLDDGAESPVSAGEYQFVAGAPGRFAVNRSTPQPSSQLGGVRIDFAAGYADENAVPDDLKQAVLTLAAHFYERREAASETRIYDVPQTVDALVAPYRQVRL